MTNETDARFSTNFYGYRLHKLVDGEEYLIGPWVVPEPLYHLDSGASHEWSGNFSTSTTDVEHSPEETERAWFNGLGGGRYVWTGTGWFDDDGQVRVAWPFEFDAEPLSPEPRELSTEREGSTLIVDAGGGTGNGATVTARRAGDAASDRRVIPEQLVRFPRLRNTIPRFEDGIEEVELRNSTSWGLGVRRSNSPVVVAYQGASYELTAR